MFFRKRREQDADNVRANILCLNPDPTEVYVVTKHFAGDDPDEKRRLVEAKLEISLNADDWYKFQDQAFYPELIQYLDNLKTQIYGKLLDTDSN